MSKVIFTSVIAAVSVMAAILSLFVFANAFAADDDDDNVSVPKNIRDKSGRVVTATPVKNLDDKPDKITKCFGPCDHRTGPNDNADSRISKINRLFRSSSNNGGGSIDNIPVIPKMNFDTVNGINSTATV